MAKTDFKSVEDYIRTFPDGMQRVLEEIRSIIKAAVPDAEEVISYQIPAYRLDGWVVYFSGHARHFSLSFPPPFTVFEVFEEQLAPYKKSKSAVRFPLDQPVPGALIRNMVTFRAEENASNKEQQR